MAIVWPEAYRRRIACDRSKAEDGMASDFLASRGMGGLGSPRDVSRGVVPQGKKIARPAVAAKAVEAQPSFGQISP